MGITSSYRVRQDIFYGLSVRKILENHLNKDISDILHIYQFDRKPRRKKNLTSLLSSGRLNGLSIEPTENGTIMKLTNELLKIEVLNSGEIQSARIYSRDGKYLSPIQKLTLLNIGKLLEDELISLLTSISDSVDKYVDSYMECKRDIIRYKKARQISVNSIIPFVERKLCGTGATSFSIEHNVDSFKIIIMGLKHHAICVDANYESFPTDLNDLDVDISQIFQLFSEIDNINESSHHKINIFDKGKYVRNRQWIKLKDNGNNN